MATWLTLLFVHEMEEEGTLHEVLFSRFPDASVHAHVVPRTTGTPEKKPETADCWKCLVGKTVTALTGVEVDVKRFSLQDLNKPHNPSRKDCRCFECFKDRLRDFVSQSRDYMFELNHCVLQLDTQLQTAYAQEDERMDEMFDLREQVAQLTGEQLARDERVAVGKQAGAKKAKARKGRKKAAARSPAASPTSAHDGERKLVPVFGDKPSVQGGAFAALDSGTEGDEEACVRVPPRSRVVGPPPPLILAPLAPPSQPVPPLTAAMRWGLLTKTEIRVGEEAPSDNGLDNDGNPFGLYK